MELPPLPPECPDDFFHSTSITVAVDDYDDTPRKLKMPMPLCDALVLHILDVEDQTMDLTFVCIDGEVKAHRLIIAAASKFLAQLLSDYDHDRWENATIFLPDVTVDVMETVRSLCYVGVTNYPKRIEEEVFKVLQMLLVGDNGSFMTSLIEYPIDPENVELDLTSPNEEDDIVRSLNSVAEPGASVQIVLSKEIVEELVRECKARARRFEFAADEGLQQKTSGSKQASVWKERLDILKDGSVSSVALPNYPQLEIRTMASSSLETGKTDILEEVNHAETPQKKNKRATKGAEAASSSKKSCRRGKRAQRCQDENDETKRRMTRQRFREEKRNSLTSISSNEDIFMPVKVRKRDKKFLLTPSKLKERSELSQKPGPSLDIGQINKLYESLGQLTRNNSTNSSPDNNRKAAVTGPLHEPPYSK